MGNPKARPLIHSDKLRIKYCRKFKYKLLFCTTIIHKIYFPGVFPKILYIIASTTKTIGQYNNQTAIGFDIEFFNIHSVNGEYGPNKNPST